MGSVVAADFKYIFVLDDDTIFPDGFVFPDIPEGKVTACGYNICAVNKERTRDGLVVKLQDWEYKAAGYRKYVQVFVRSSWRSSKLFFRDKRVQQYSIMALSDSGIERHTKKRGRNTMHSL